MNAHRKLEAWQVCRLLTRDVYRVTRSFPRHEMFGLTTQLRRAAISAGANIAEGYARCGAREKAHGANIALGSLAEVDSLIAVAEDEGYLSGIELRNIEALRERASMVTSGLHKKLRKSAET